MKTIVCDICGSRIYGIKRHRIKTIFGTGDKYVKDICSSCWDDIETEIRKRRKENNEDNN